MNKIKIHIRNNHWKEGFLPCDEAGEKHSTITKKSLKKDLINILKLKIRLNI